MKKLVFTLSLLLATQALATEPPQSLLKARLSGGMPRPGGNPFAEIYVDTDGVVTLIRGTTNPRAPKLNVELSRLSAPALQVLQDKVAQLEPGELRDANPELPPCYDGPSTTFTAKKPGAEPFPFHLNQQCKQFVLESQSTYPLVEFLEAFLAIGRSVQL